MHLISFSLLFLALIKAFSLKKLFPTSYCWPMFQFIIAHFIQPGNEMHDFLFRKEEEKKKLNELFILIFRKQVT